MDPGHSVNLSTEVRESPRREGMTAEGRRSLARFRRGDRLGRAANVSRSGAKPPVDLPQSIHRFAIARNPLGQLANSRGLVPIAALTRTRCVDRGEESA